MSGRTDSCMACMDGHTDRHKERRIDEQQNKTDWTKDGRMHKHILRN